MICLAQKKPYIPFMNNSTFASRQLPAVKYIISRSKVIAHPHQFTLPPP